MNIEDYEVRRSGGGIEVKYLRSTPIRCKLISPERATDLITQVDREKPFKYWIDYDKLNNLEKQAVYNLIAKEKEDLFIKKYMRNG